MTKSLRVLLLFAFLSSVIQCFAQDPEIKSVRVTRATPDPTPTSTVRGRVFYAETSRPVRRASIMLMSANMRGGPGEGSGLTDNEGVFEIKGVPAGTYYAMVNAPGVVSPLAFLDFSKLDRGRDMDGATVEEAFKDFQRIVVNGVNDIDVQIAARRGGAIAGRVMYDDGDAAIGVKVEILRKVEDRFVGVIPNFSAVVGMFGGGSGSFQTDDRGVFRFSGLPPGEYIVKATENVNHSGAKNSQSFETLLLGGGGSFLTIYHPDVFDPASAQLINVEYGQELTEINVTIPGRYLYKISGRVTSRKDKTPVKAEIMLQRVAEDKTFSVFTEIARRMQAVPTDDNGAWLFKELPKGVYKVIVSPARAVPDYSDDSDGTGPKPKVPEPPKFAKKIQEITVEDKDLAEINVELGFGASVSGTVAVENLFNEMPDGVTIRAENEVAELNASGGVWNYAERDPSKPGKLNHDFNLENVSEGKTKFSIVLGDGDYYVKSMTAGSTDLLAGVYEIKEGEKLANVKIVLGKGLATLKGTVTGDDKEPVSGAQMMLVPTDAKRRNSTFQRNARTGDTGEYEVKLAPGEYALIFVTEDDLRKKGEAWDSWLEAELKKAQTVKLESGKTETLNLKRVK